MDALSYELLYDLPVGEYSPKGVDGVRTKTIRAGKSLEVMVYPIVRPTPEAKRELKRRKTTRAMAAVNARNRELNHMRLLEENFTPLAIVVTATYAYPAADYGMCDLKELSDLYDKRRLPWHVERVQMDKRNFLAKLQRRVLKAGGTAKDFKWDITIEEGKEPPGVGLPPKYHLHCVIEGPGLTREVIETCWDHGHAQTRLFDMEDDGPKRLAHYLNKQKHPGRWWSHSRNLKIPQPRISDRKISRRRLKTLAAECQREQRAIFEKKLYKGYKLCEFNVSWSDYVNGCYIYARMRRRD